MLLQRLLNVLAFQAPGTNVGVMAASRERQYEGQEAAPEQPGDHAGADSPSGDATNPQAAQALHDQQDDQRLNGCRVVGKSGRTLQQDSAADQGDGGG